MAKASKVVGDKKLSKSDKKLDKLQKQALREEADRKHFQNTDQKSLSEISAQKLVRPADVDQPITVSPTAGGDKMGKIPHMAVSNQASVLNVLSEQASIVLGLAAGVGVLLALVGIGSQEGKMAVQAIGGISPTAVPGETGDIVLALDILFPLLFGSGLALLIASVQSRGNRPIIRIALTAILIGVLSDFTENSLVYAVLKGGVAHPLIFTFTLVKYASLAFAGVLAAAVLPAHNFLGKIVHLITRYVFPIGIALLVSGLAGETGRLLIGGSFPIFLIVLAIYASQLSRNG